ncbi:MAG: hypothetical protein E7604_05790 [Ruminococcaceae bacterium]|nr:hypothetical protein [Oscillospiraceae bacterium]
MKHVIHTTDCFHPHNDPDDHFDLALQYALAAMGHLSLDGVIIDHPSRSQGGPYAPAAAACAQLGMLSGVTVPVTVGAAVGTRCIGDTLEDLGIHGTRGADEILRVLRRNPEKTALVMVGEASDIAAAVSKAPELFREKCAGIYLVAGTASHPDGIEREWNVMCGRAAYITVMRAPCPVYWCPCFQALGEGGDYFGEHNFGENSGLFFEAQGPLFEAMPTRLRAFFSFMFEKSTDPLWLDALERTELSDAYHAETGRMRRFYSTSAILHAAGLSADASGALVPTEDTRAIFSYVPITASCDSDGVVRWTYAEKPDPDSPRCILHINDDPHFGGAMMRTMAALYAILQ